MMQYNAEDSGDVARLNSSSGMLALKTLTVKRGCPVMLLRNLSDNLVNGSTGRVVDLNEDGPVVHFLDADVVLKLPKCNFTGTFPTLL
jgi:hypothetical protein